MKKSQIQLGENIIILFIFFILLVFAAVFFTRLQSTKIEKKVSEDIEGRALEISQRIEFLPEFQCSKNNAEIRPGCYDEFSILGLEELNPEDKEYYFDLFGNSRVSIQKLFPSKDENPHIIYEREIENATNIIATNTPIILCNFANLEVKGKCSFAVLKVEVFT
jgi:hypothetical protein